MKIVLKGNSFKGLDILKTPKTLGTILVLICYRHFKLESNATFRIKSGFLTDERKQPCMVKL
ncbi:hypothetical protein HanIR_Chr12g0608391 [Helianthus annuus]|nr:hypothetical protein HanIR_Chr12g0608391 [Helianthus annuus]